MKFQRFKAIVQLASLIFTGIMVLEAAVGQTLTYQVTWGLLICAAAAAFLKFSFFSENLFEASLIRQAAYLILVWLIFLLCNFLSGRGFGKEVAVSILAEVLIIYFAIRMINYQLVKMEVKRMNKRLGESGKRRKDKERKEEREEDEKEEG